MNQIRWGILSTGTIAKKFAASLQQLPDCGSCIAVGSRSRQTAEAFAKDYGLAKAYDSYEALAADPEVDIVYIATPHSHHYANAKLCLQHDKHVLCEKSFTIDAKQASELFALATEKGLFIMEAFWTKFLPAYQLLNRTIEDKAIGELLYFRAQYGFAPTGARYQRKMDPALAGGALLDIGVYAIGVAAMLLGYNPQKVDSTAIIGEHGTDTFNSITLSYANGAAAHLATSIGTIMEPQAVLVGTKGHIVMPGFSALQEFTVNLNEGSSYAVKAPFEINGFEYQIREAEKCVRNHKTESDVMSHQNTLDILKLMDKARADWGLTFSTL